MKIDCKERFDKAVEMLKKEPGFIYVRDARLFCAEGPGSKYPLIVEMVDGHTDIIPLYATIQGKTLPANSGLELALYDVERAMPIPIKPKKSDEDETITFETKRGIVYGSRNPGANINTAIARVFVTGVASHFGKPLEVVAKEIKIGYSSKWEIALLRDIGDEIGYVNSSYCNAVPLKYPKVCNGASK